MVTMNQQSKKIKMASELTSLAGKDNTKEAVSNVLSAINSLVKAESALPSYKSQIREAINKCKDIAESLEY